MPKGMENYGPFIDTDVASGREQQTHQQQRWNDLKDSLDAEKWQKLDVANKKGFHEFQVMRQHKKMNPTCFRYLIQPDADADPKGVVIEFTAKDKDPLKNVGTVELLLKDDKVVGIDVDGDCFEMK